MLEIIVRREGDVVRTEARRAILPEPAADEVLVRVFATSSNPKDWKAASVLSINQGDDIAGVVAKVGSRVYEFKPGDRVAAFHKMFQPGGSYAEYAIAPQSTTFHLPPNVCFEAAATLPLACMTAALALYQQLRVPLPWSPMMQGGKQSSSSFPILIYGGASTVGSYALKMAKLSNLGPIITVAGSGIEFVKSLDIAHYIVDYRRNRVVEDIRAILDRHQIHLMHAFDCVAKHGTWNHVTEVLQDGGSINMVDPPDPPVPSWPRGISYSRVFVSTAYGVPYEGNRSPEEAASDADFAQAFYRYLAFLLHDGRLQPHPYEVQPDGLFGVQRGVQRLYDGEVSAKKLVYRLSDTPHLEQYN